MSLSPQPAPMGNPLNGYLKRFLGLYVLIGSALVVLYSLVKVGGAFAMITPGLLALVVGQSFVRDYGRRPTNEERTNFTVLASLGVLATTAVMAVIASLAYAIFRGDSIGAGLDQLGNATPMGLVMGALLFAAINAVLIYVLVGVSANQEWRNSR
ncbi:MAG: ABZJ_00895 family protein [Nocardioides sp.]